MRKEEILAGSPDARTFEDGTTLGGEILYEERPWSVRSRRRGVFLGLYTVLVGSVITAPFLLVLPLDSLWPLFLLEAALGVLSLVGIAIEKPTYGNVTPFRAYQRGISAGWGDRPYHSFHTLYCIEERRTHRRKTLHTTLTFTDGSDVTFSEAPMSGFVYLAGGDYRRIAVDVKNCVGGTLFPRVPWEPEAEALVTAHMLYQGLPRLRIEEVAKIHGVPKVTKEFVLSHLREIAGKPDHPATAFVKRVTAELEGRAPS